MQGHNDHSQSELDGNPQRPDSTRFQRLERHVLGRMASGFLVLIPLIVTALIGWVVTTRLDGFVPSYVEDKGWDFPGIGLLVLLVVLYVTGALVSSKVGRRILNWPSIVLTRVPILKSIYGVAEQATDALTSSTGHRFSRVVFLEWPREGFMAMGFVTGHSHSRAGGESLVAVYIPTVPNPTSGNLAFVSEEDLVETDMSVEDAMKVVFSGGIVLPDALRMAPWASLPRPPGDGPPAASSPDPSRTTPFG